MKLDIKAIWAICCFRLNPLLLQGSWLSVIGLGLLTFGLEISLGFLNPHYDTQTIIGIRLISSGIEIALLSLLLFFKNQEHVWANFFSTLFKVNLVFILSAALLELFLLQLPKNSPFVGLAILQIFLMVWNLLVNGFIFQHFFRVSLFHGFMLAFTIMVITLSVIINVYPKVYSEVLAAAQAEAAKQATTESSN